MTRVRSVRITTGVVLWLAAAAAATVVGLFAVGAIGDDIFGADAREPLSQSEVDRRLAGSTSTASTSSPTPSSAPSSSAPPAAKSAAVHSAGGTVIARCAAEGLVQVLGETPAQGYQVESEHDGLDDHPKITFSSGEQEIEVRLRCVGGRITNEIKYD